MDKVQGSFINDHQHGRCSMGAIPIFLGGQQRNHKRLKPHPAPDIQGHTQPLYALYLQKGWVKGRKHVNISFRGVNRFCRLETWGAFCWGVWFSYSGLLGLHAYSSSAALWIRLKSILLSEQTTQLVMLCKKK